VAIQEKSMLTFIVYARRTPEVLARVVLLFHGRRIEIDSLVAGRVEKSDVLRMEVTVEVDQRQVSWIEANLYKVVDVLLVKANNRDREAARRLNGDEHRES
jgi:acetolactate synthase small subunit